MKYPEVKFDRKWVTGDEVINDDVVNWTKSFGQFLAPNDRRDRDALSTSQIRKFFGEIKRIQSSFDKKGHEVPLLKAKLAYAVGRANRNSRIKYFYEEISKGISVVKNEKDFNRFVNICESIVAFHKYHGGKD